MCGRGEIGIRTRLKILRPYGLAGSSPAVRTTHLYYEQTLILLKNKFFCFSRYQWLIIWKESLI